MSEDDAIAAHYEWITGEDEPDACSECGAVDDEPCARGCPNERPVPYAVRVLIDAEDECMAALDARADAAEDQWRGDRW